MLTISNLISVTPYSVTLHIQLHSIKPTQARLVIKQTYHGVLGPQRRGSSAKFRKCCSCSGHAAGLASIYAQRVVLLKNGGIFLGIIMESERSASSSRVDCVSKLLRPTRSLGCSCLQRRRGFARRLEQRPAEID